MIYNAKYWIDRLELQKHPEGGYFKEIYKSNKYFDPGSEYSGNRSHYTSIYFLITKDSPSKFHSISSDEIWHYYTGDIAVLNYFDDSGDLQQRKLGIIEDAFPQFLINANYPQAAYTEGEYTLLGCTVAPGFEYSDFNLHKFEKLKSCYPKFEKLIKKLT
jgi:hypothetical protein